MGDVVKDLVVPTGGLVVGVVLTLTGLSGIKKLKDGYWNPFGCSYSKEHIEDYLKGFKDDDEAGKAAKDAALSAIVSAESVAERIDKAAADRPFEFRNLSQQERDKVKFADLSKGSQDEVGFVDLSSEQQEKVAFADLSSKQQEKVGFANLSKKEQDKVKFANLSKNEQEKVAFADLSSEQQGKVAFANLSKKEQEKVGFANLSQQEKNKVQIFDLTDVDKFTGSNSLYAKLRAKTSVSNGIDPSNFSDGTGDVSIGDILNAGKDYGDLGANCQAFVQSVAEGAGYTADETGAKAFLAAMRAFIKAI